MCALSYEHKQKISNTLKHRWKHKKHHMIGKKLPESTINKLKGRIPWNKGLTTETDNRVKKYVEFGRKTKLKLYKKGKIIVWNKGLKGIHLSPKSEWKKGNIPWIQGKKHSRESIECMKKSQNTPKMQKIKYDNQFNKKRPKISGSKHWNWKGGISKINRTDRENITNTIEYKMWRRAVFERDNYICQVCDIKGNIINAHHINMYSLFPSERFEINNGATCCEGECHNYFNKLSRETVKRTVSVGGN